MNDRELLELAAKAIGKSLRWQSRPMKDVDGYIYHQVFAQLEGQTREWNPLINDGDALRLAVDLGIELYFEGKEQSESVWANEVMLWTEGNRHSATRKAITMAAAEIGRNME